MLGTRELHRQIVPITPIKTTCPFTNLGLYPGYEMESAISIGPNVEFSLGTNCKQFVLESNQN